MIVNKLRSIISIGLLLVLLSSCRGKEQPIPPPLPKGDSKVKLEEVTFSTTSSEVELPLVIGYEEFN